MNSPKTFPFDISGDRYVDEQIELTAETQQMVSDYDWAINDPGLRKKYQGNVVAIHRRIVLGYGKDHGDALRSAGQHPHAPDDEAAITLVPIVGGIREPAESVSEKTTEEIRSPRPIPFLSFQQRSTRT